jgi:hypothetical protein
LLIGGPLLAVQAALLAWSAYIHSPTTDEIAYLPAGISHWQFGRFELYRANPPLVRMVAALPVLPRGTKRIGRSSTARRAGARSSASARTF